MTGAQHVPPLMRFSEACSLVVAYLRKTIPLAFWSVTRFDGERQIYVCVADGAYGDLRCLHIPAECVLGIPADTLLEKALTSATEKNGYRRKFHHGPRVANAKAKGSPSPFLKSFAYTAVPITPGKQPSGTAMPSPMRA